MTKSGRHRTGFTLLEVLLVMAILVILVAVSFPSMMAMYGDSKVRGAADEVVGAWAEARARAIDDGVPYRFAVMPGKERYRIAPDSPEFWDGSKETSDDADDGRVKTGSLPSGIVFQLGQNLSSEAGGWCVIVTFLPEGNCRVPDGSDYAQIAVSYEGSSLFINVRALTGIVTVRTQKQLAGGR
jgi:prepilin-type N-terminal cleavage/methylation domain-containing protein